MSAGAVVVSPRALHTLGGHTAVSLAGAGTALPLGSAVV